MTHTSNERATETVLFAGLCARNFAKTESAITVQRAFRIRFSCLPPNDNNILSAVPPRFNQSFEVKTVKEHQEVTLSCDAHGESPLTVSWKRYQRPIDRSVLSRYVLREHVHPNGLKSQLSIPSVLRADSGLFSCEAVNDYGREEKSIQLIVQGASLWGGNWTSLSTVIGIRLYGATLKTVHGECTRSEMVKDQSATEEIILNV
ncbi:ig-like domain-containing protein [Trichonephila clavipes]|nr:ig-like domain-containing protein [Trichonephila clavipes]